MGLSEAAAGFEAGYEALYRAHGGHVRRLSRLLLNDPQDAEEVSQEVFTKLYQEYRRGGARAWGPWLNRVTVNACLDRRRSAWWRWRRDAATELDEAALASEWLSPEDEAVGQQMQGRIWRAYRRLPRRQREVFVLRQVEGWSTDEVARALGLRSGSVKRHLFRAVRSLRRALGENA
jgi:RNA polymerase sigma-70 factor, ECF subfamily